MLGVSKIYTSKNNRIDYIDTAKGIGIILVVWCHILLTGPVHKYVYSFHMPLFFFLSGLVFKENKNENMMSFVKSKSKGILIPYISFSAITYLYWLIIERFISSNEISPLKAFINIFIAPGSDSYLPHNPALWFLPCLLVVNIIFYVIVKNYKLINIKIAIFISSVIGFITQLYKTDNVFWSIDVAFTGGVFFGVGFLLKETLNDEYKVINNKTKIIGFLLFVIAIVTSYYNNSVSLSSNHYGNYILFYVSAFSSIAMIIIISKIISKNSLLKYLGKNSLIILCLHIPVKRIVMGVTCKILNIKLELLKESIVITLICTLITFIILIPFINIINNRRNFIIGKKIESKSL